MVCVRNAHALLAHFAHDRREPSPTRHKDQIPVKPWRHAAFNHLFHTFPPPLRISPPADNCCVWVNLAEFLDKMGARRVSNSYKAFSCLAQGFQEFWSVVFDLVHGKPFPNINYRRCKFTELRVYE